MFLRWPFYFLDLIAFGVALGLAIHSYVSCRDRRSAMLLPWLVYSFALSAWLSIRTLMVWFQGNLWADPLVTKEAAVCSASLIVFSAVTATWISLDAKKHA